PAHLADGVRALIDAGRPRRVPSLDGCPLRPRWAPRTRSGPDPPGAGWSVEGRTDVRSRVAWRHARSGPRLAAVPARRRARGRGGPLVLDPAPPGARRGGVGRPRARLV